MPGNWNIWISAGVMRSIDCSSSLQLQVTFQRSLLPDERYVRGPDEIQRQLNWGCVVECVCIPNQTFVLPSLDSTRITITDNKVQQLHNKLPIFAKVVVERTVVSFLTRCESSIRFFRNRNFVSVRFFSDIRCRVIMTSEKRTETQLQLLQKRIDNLHLVKNKMPHFFYDNCGKYRPILIIHCWMQKWTSEKPDKISIFIEAEIIT